MLLFLFICNTLLLRAQPDKYVLHQYNSENGLPQNTVKFIQFDKSGFCWLATESGIVRFDNHNFKPYGSDLIRGLRAERISAMMADSSGNIMIQNIDNQNFTIRSSSDLNSFVPVKTHNDFSFVNLGYVLKNPVMDSLWESIRRKVNVPLLKQTIGLRNGDIYMFYDDDAYFITKNKVTPLIPYSTQPLGTLILNERYFLQIWSDNHIKTWYNGVGETGRILGDIATNKDFLKGNFKALWCNRGAYIYSGGNLYELNYTEGYINSKLVIGNLNIELPLCIAYRPEINTYYIGTGTQGLIAVKVPDFIYPQIPEKSGPQNYYAIAKTSDDDIIVNNAIIRPDNSAIYAALNNIDSRAFFCDDKDNIYYESGFSLFRYNARNGLIDKNILLLDNRLIDILADKDGGSLLLCTHTRLYKITPAGKVIWQKKFPEGIKAAGLLPLNNKEYLMSTSTGLKWYDLDKNHITKTVLDSFRIRTFYRDKAKRIWIGTDGKGSFLYAGNRLYALPAGPRNAFRSIHSFIEDGKGNFWLPTNNGLYKATVNSLVDFVTGKSDNVYWFTFNQGNGLRTTEFNGGANPNFQWLKDGALILPSINGLVKFYPDRLKSDFPQERIFIDEITIDGQNIDLSTLNGKLKLKPTFQILNFKITCPYFGNTENLKLEYKLGTDNGQWIGIPSSGIISINRLPANDYTLTIRKAGGSLSTPNDSIRVMLEVSPFFYQTVWFFSGILVLIICMGYWYSRRRLVKLEKEKLKIEQIVEVRTMELSSAVQQLEHSKTALKKSNEVKEQIIATVLHDLRSPLFSMRMTGKALVKNWNESVEENLNQVKGLNHLIGELSRFTDQFFSWAASQQDHFRIEKTHFSLQHLFDDIESLFKEILLVNNNKFQNNFTDIECFTDKDILVLILRNLVDNANKNTENGTISIAAFSIWNGFKIEVSDTGKGLNAFQIENFLDKDKAVKNGRMGSVIILEMLSNINGELFVNSEEGKGSVFTIQVYS